MIFYSHAVYRERCTKRVLSATVGRASSLCRVYREHGIGDEDVGAQWFAEDLQSVDAQVTGCKHLAILAVQYIIGAEGSGEVGLHCSTNEQRVGVEKLFCQPSEIHLPFYGGAHSWRALQVGDFPTHIQRSCQALEDKLLEGDKRRVGMNAAEMEVEVHLQRVDALLHAVHVVCSVVHLTAEVDRRHNAVANVSVYVAIQIDGALYVHFLFVLEIGFGNKIHEVVEVRHLETEVHVYLRLVHLRHTADGTVGGEGKIVYTQLGILQRYCVIVVGKKNAALQP